MKRTTSSFRWPLGLLAILSAWLGLLGSMTMATPITATKDSADFPFLYNGADVPNLNGWSFAYGDPAVATASGTQMITDTLGPRGVWHNDDTAGTLSHGTGYTVEVKYQITRDDNQGLGAWGAIMSDDANGPYNFIISLFGSDSVKGDGFVITGTEKDYTDGFHIVRWGQPANEDTVYLWVDGQLVTTTHSDNFNGGYNRIRLGVIYNGQSGSAVVDWVRIDNTGGFAPEALLIPGDLNGDGFVGQDDLNFILGNWGSNVTPGSFTLGDPSGDGFVGQDDLNILLGNWGAGSQGIVSGGGLSASLVPEPSSILLLAIAMPFGLSHYRRRQRRAA